MSMLLAQISDLHIKRPGLLAYKKVDTTAYLRRCVARLNTLVPRPHALVITGDLSDFGAPQEYESLRRELALLQMPCYLMVGNHDHRENLRAAFPDHSYLGDGPGYIQYAIDFDELSLIALDTQDPPNSGGRLDDERLAWLDAQLEARRGKAVIVGMHHPPFACGIRHMDVQALAAADARRLEALLLRHDHVERLICGHVHRSVTMRYAHTVASICPSPAHQVAYDLAPDGPSAFIMEPPALLMHARVQGRWVTHTVYVEEYGGRYPFYDAEGKLID